MLRGHASQGALRPCVALHGMMRGDSHLYHKGAIFMLLRISPSPQATNHPSP